MADKNKKVMQEDMNNLLYSLGQYGTARNEEKAGYEGSKAIEKDSKLDKGYKNERHNDNARASAADEPENPRINTDNL